MAASLCSVTTEEEVRIRMEVQNLQGPVAMPRALLTAHEQSRDPTEWPKLCPVKVLRLWAIWPFFRDKMCIRLGVPNAQGPGQH